MCENVPHNIRVCNYLRCQRKVIVDDFAQREIKNMERRVKILKKYRRILRKFEEKEDELYEINEMKVHSDVCWKTIREEVSSSSEAVVEFKM